MVTQIGGAGGSTGMTLPVVMIGAPARNRAWVLSRYLSALDGLDYPREAMRFCWVINDSTDGTDGMLHRWAGVARASGAQVRLVHQDFGTQASKSEERGYYRLEHLAQLRNRLLEEFLASDADYLLSLDTDIILPQGALHQLMTNDRDLVAGLIRNDGHMPGCALTYYNICRRTERAGEYEHIHELPADPLFEVDLTGAVIMIRRQVVEVGVRYRATPFGEDAGFCISAQAAGFSIWCDQRIRPLHVMTREVSE